MGKMFFNILATFAEFESDLIRLRTREGMAVARAKGKLKGKKPKLSEKTAEGTAQDVRHRGILDQRPVGAIPSVAADDLSHTGATASSCLNRLVRFARRQNSPMRRETKLPSTAGQFRVLHCSVARRICPAEPVA